MQALAAKVAPVLQAGDVIVLDGPLGAGKTTFTQGLGEALGVIGLVTSPTFVVSRMHKPAKDLGLIHVDAYRLDSAEGLLDLELDQLGNNVLVMEWGRPYISQLTDEWLEIEISRDDVGTNEDPAGGIRTVSITGHGSRWQNLEALA